MNKMMMMVGETDQRRGVISEMDEKKSLLSSSTLCVSHLPCTFRVLIARRERQRDTERAIYRADSAD
jgi:hypothetical protein